MSTITMNRTTPVARAATRTTRTTRATGSTRSSTGTRPAPVRLTRRGRWVLTLLMLAVIFAVSLAVGSVSVASGEQGEAPATRTVVVGEGDSLWGIAAQTAEPGEVREVMYEIERLNQLGSSALQVGQELVVPAG